MKAGADEEVPDSAVKSPRLILQS